MFKCRQKSRRLGLGAVFCLLLSLPACSDARKDPATMRVKELRQLLADRGVECIGCSEKEHYVQRARETENTKKRSPAGKVFGRLKGDPNEWIDHNQDIRFDLAGSVSRAFSQVLALFFSMLWSNKIITATCLPFVTYYLLKYTHRNLFLRDVIFFARADITWTGPHNDIPFKQYLRFMARRTSKLFLRGADWLLGKASWGGRMILVVAVFLWRWLLRRTKWQALHAAAVLTVFLGFVYLGFAAPGVTLVGFYLIFANLGTRMVGQKSAYSVFNNFEQLDGELRMEQIEAELRHQPLQNNARGRADRVARIEGGGELDVTSLPQIKAPGRNDRVEVIGPTGEHKVIKFKSLQSLLDIGYSQVERVRYEGVRYSKGSVAAEGWDGDDDDEY